MPISIEASPTPFAVLMDAGAVFFAVRDLYEGLQLEYPILANVVCRRFPSELKPPNPNHTQDPDRLWAMWTSYHPQNTGQARFLEYAEGKLGWVARRFDPAESYIIDPQTILGISKSTDGGNSRAVNRLVRFDASIAYAIGRIADTHKIVLITDSYALAEPLVRAAIANKQKNCIAFFGRVLDPRWLGLLRGKAAKHIDFIDLDVHADELFGTRRDSMYAWEAEFPIQ